MIRPMPKTVSCLFESPEIGVWCRHGNGPYALVTFSHLDWSNKHEEFWGSRLAERLGVTAVGVVARRDNWFPAQAMREAAPCIRNKLAAYRQVISYGSSMGGYAALKYSALAGASHALAFAPQYTIAPEVAGGNDLRFQRHYDPALHEGMETRRSDVCPAAWAFYDPSVTADQWNIDMLVNQAPWLHPIRVPSVGHKALEVFAGTQRTGELFARVLRGDVGAVVSHAQGLRRTSAVRLYNVITRLIERCGPAPGIEALERRLELFDGFYASMTYTAAANAFMARQQMEQAQMAARRACDLASYNRAALITMSRLQEATGNHVAAAEWIGKAVAAHPADGSMRWELARLHQRWKDWDAAEAVLQEGLGIQPGNKRMRAELEMVRQRRGG
jgi:tetratricopeptide (TPR) repeat protein